MPFPLAGLILPCFLSSIPNDFSFWKWQVTYLQTLISGVASFRAISSSVYSRFSIAIRSWRVSASHNYLAILSVVCEYLILTTLDKFAQCPLYGLLWGGFRKPFCLRYIATSRMRDIVNSIPPFPRPEPGRANCHGRYTVPSGNSTMVSSSSLFTVSLI